MTSDRCYRAAGTSSAAIAELRKRCWTQFDARVVAALERLQDEQPGIADVRQAG
jgi:HD-GYP domain-containing protein (c-di-GMP phosphodiesterase class II)